MSHYLFLFVMHSVRQLYQYRKSISTKPFNARGKKVLRCEHCQVAEQHCICQIANTADSNAAFVLLMHDAEVLKPSNTARLIADLFDETHAFLWSRTEPNQPLLTLLNDERYLPLVVFPSMYVEPNRELYCNSLPVEQLRHKKPLFILFDGSWREAKKMFRKSPYLNKFPVVSFDKNKVNHYTEQYYIRDSEVDNQLATAQVASCMLSLYGEQTNAKLLSTWFDVFTYAYQQSVCQKNKGNPDAMAEFIKLQQAMNYIEKSNE